MVLLQSYQLLPVPFTLSRSFLGLCSIVRVTGSSQSLPNTWGNCPTLCLHCLMAELTSRLAPGLPCVTSAEVHSPRLLCPVPKAYPKDNVETPKPSIASSNSKPRKADTVTLTCEPEIQDASYLWWINGENPSSSSRLQLSNDNRTLVLFSVTEKDTGLYECEVKNTVSASRSDPVFLKVLREYLFLCGPRLPSQVHMARGQASQLQVQRPLPLDIEAGHNFLPWANQTDLPQAYITSNKFTAVEHVDEVTLTCVPAVRNAIYLWWVNGQSLPFSPRMQWSDDNRTLTLNKVTRNDTGSYECGIQTSMGPIRSDPVTLNVLCSSTTPLLLDTRAGHDFLPCENLGGHSLDQEYRGRDALVMGDLGPQLVMGQTDGPDFPRISPSKTVYHRGRNLHLYCFADSNPPAEYRWMVNGMLLLKGQEVHVPRITTKNSGLYGCFVHNSATGKRNLAFKEIKVGK
ncbi:hypothetical protein P7K49_034500 [Saguinus oedipus]|uniref:Ig-like domain-containing protein n=1 Tax=Saguinus oedipus TaxID=9490 RepID=A0ABQ9TUX0_SAGOE|nr:hypothetical protein P7K49_034500 [Saguinus oedipus]